MTKDGLGDYEAQHCSNYNSVVPISRDDFSFPLWWRNQLTWMQRSTNFSWNQDVQQCSRSNSSTKLEDSAIQNLRRAKNTWWRLRRKDRRVLSRQLHTDLRKKTIEQLLQQLMDFMLLIEMPQIFEFLPFLNQHLSSWLVTSLLQTWWPRMDYGEAEGEGNRTSKIVRWKDFK